MVPASPPEPPSTVSMTAVHSEAGSLLVTFAHVACVDTTVDPCNGAPVSRYRVQWAETLADFANYDASGSSSSGVGNSSRWRVGVAMSLPVMTTSAQ